MRAYAWFIVLALVAIGSIGCSDTVSPTAPSAVTPVPNPGLTATLERAIQDEYRAETIYQGVLNDFGRVLPFANILTAETRHSSAIARLFTTRGLAVPSNPWSVDRVPHFASVAAACAAGVAAERENIALYDELLQGTLPDDVRQVFMNNRSASLVAHQPAFERCA